MNQSTADVVITGAGIIGASIAWRLAQQRLGVTLLDAGQAGTEASWASAGMLAPGGEVARRSTWSDLAVEASRRYPAFLAELGSEAGIPLLYHGCGAVEIALTEDECQAMLERAAVQREMGIPVEAIGAQGLARLIPSAAQPVAGAWFYPGDAVIDPREVMRALEAACRERGVCLHEGSGVSRIDASRDGVTVTAGSRRIMARASVLAAGAWSSTIPCFREGEPCSLPQTYPVRGILLGYQMQPGSLGPVLRHHHTYMLQRPNGYTLAGTTVEQVGFNRRIDPEGIRDVAGRAAALWPPLAAAGEPEAWLGFRPGADAPVIQRLAESRLWLAYGHFRNGILLAPVTAARIAQEISAS